VFRTELGRSRISIHEYNVLNNTLHYGYLKVGTLMRQGNRKGFKQGPQRHKGENRYESMLDLGRVVLFEYDAREVFKYSEIDERISKPLLASIVSKAGRQSIRVAVEYIESKEKEGIISKSDAKRLIGLLSKYKKWR